jgi:hypothetical protein
VLVGGILAMKTSLPITQNRIAFSHPQEFDCSKAQLLNYKKMSFSDE